MIKDKQWEEFNYEQKALLDAYLHKHSEALTAISKQLADILIMPIMPPSIKKTFTALENLAKIIESGIKNKIYTSKAEIDQKWAHFVQIRDDLVNLLTDYYEPLFKIIDSTSYLNISSKLAKKYDLLSRDIIIQGKENGVHKFLNCHNTDFSVNKNIMFLKYGVALIVDINGKQSYFIDEKNNFYKISIVNMVSFSKLKLICENGLLIHLEANKKNNELKIIYSYKANNANSHKELINKYFQIQTNVSEKLLIFVEYGCDAKTDRYTDYALLFPLASVENKIIITAKMFLDPVENLIKNVAGLIWINNYEHELESLDLTKEFHK